MHLHFLVGSLPLTSTYGGIRAVTSTSGNGAYAQFEDKLYELSCDSASCSWSQLSEGLSVGLKHAVALHLPMGSDLCPTTTTTTTTATTSTSMSGMPQYETILLMGRNNQDDPLPTIIMDVDGGGVNCTVNHPITVPRHAVGGLLDNQYPIHCGGSNVGWDDAAGYEQGCYEFGESIAFQQLSVKRYRAAAVVLDDSRLWVTGGVDGYPNYLASTEYVSLDPTKRGPGPDMPMALWTHCLVRIDATHAMLLGKLIYQNNVTSVLCFNTFTYVSSC